MRVVQCALTVFNSTKSTSSISRSTKSSPTKIPCSAPWRRIVVQPISRRHGLHMPTHTHRPFPGTPSHLHNGSIIPLTVHSAHCYLRVLRASSSCICAKILALRCRGQMIAEVSMRPATPQMLEASQSMESCLSQSASAFMAQHQYPRRNDFAFVALPEGSGNPLTSPGEAVYLPVSTGQNHCAEGPGHACPLPDAEQRGDVGACQQPQPVRGEVRKIGLAARFQQQQFVDNRKSTPPGAASAR